MRAQIPNKMIVGSDAITKALPVKPDLEVLQHEVDVVLYEGLNEMQHLLTDDDSSKNKIAAFNAIVSLGRYLEVRHENNKQSHDQLNFDLGEKLFNDKEDISGKEKI